MKRKKIVYIAHPVRGDIEGNKRKVRAIVRNVFLAGDVIPFAPYIEANEVLDDNVPAEREMGMQANEEFFCRGVIDEIWLYGDLISEGMKAEMECARQHGIIIVAKTDGTARDLRARDYAVYMQH